MGYKIRLCLRKERKKKKKTSFPQPEKGRYLDGHTEPKVIPPREALKE